MLSRGFEAPLKEQRLFPDYRWKWDLFSVAHSRGGWAGNVPKCAWFSLPRVSTSPHLCCSLSTNTADSQTSFDPRQSPIPPDSRHKRCLQLTPISHAPKCLILGRKVLFATDFCLTSLRFERVEAPRRSHKAKNLQHFSPNPLGSFISLACFALGDI